MLDLRKLLNIAVRMLQLGLQVALSFWVVKIDGTKDCSNMSNI